MDARRTTTRHPLALTALVLLLGTLPACALRSTNADGAAAPPMSELRLARLTPVQGRDAVTAGGYSDAGKTR